MWKLDGVALHCRSQVHKHSVYVHDYDKNNVFFLLSRIILVVTKHKYNVGVFKALALWADAFYKFKCLSVCPSVCPSV